MWLSSGRKPGCIFLSISIDHFWSCDSHVIFNNYFLQYNNYFSNVLYSSTLCKAIICYNLCIFRIACFYNKEANLSYFWQRWFFSSSQSVLLLTLFTAHNIILTTPYLTSTADNSKYDHPDSSLNYKYTTQQQLLYHLPCFSFTYKYNVCYISWDL